MTKQHASNSDKLHIYEALVATNPLVERKGATAEWKKFFDVSYRYVSALKPKPTAKKKGKSQGSGR